MRGGSYWTPVGAAWMVDGGRELSVRDGGHGSVGGPSGPERKRRARRGTRNVPWPCPARRRLRGDLIGHEGVPWIDDSAATSARGRRARLGQRHGASVLRSEARRREKGRGELGRGHCSGLGPICYSVRLAPFLFSFFCFF